MRDGERRRRFVAEAVVLIDAQVAARKGLSGMALRASLHAVRAVRADIVPAAVEVLAPEFARAIDGLIARSQPTGDVDTWFVAHPGEVADALLAVTDARAQRAQSPVVKRSYEALRGSARAYTMEAVPALGKLVVSSLTSS